MLGARDVKREKEIVPDLEEYAFMPGTQISIKENKCYIMSTF